MGKKKPEMSQVYGSNNEFIFGEKGGKGKHLSSFLKNLSLTSNSSNNRNSPVLGIDDFEEVNSNIYGSLSYKNQNNNTGSSSDLTNSSPKTSNNAKSSLDSISRSSTNAVSKSRHPSPKRSLSGPIGASFPYSRTNLTPTSSNTRTVSPTSKPKRVVSAAKYADLDDDWDANFNDDDLIGGGMNSGNANTSTMSASSTGFGNNPTLQASPMLDTLYPDLTLPIEQNNNVNNKQSIDAEDMKTKLEINKLNQLNTKFEKFKRILVQSSNINIQELRKLSWNGIPSNLRAITWQILLGYLPTNKSRQLSTLKMKRQEYLDGIRLMESTINFDENDNKSMSSSSINITKEKQLYHQIKIDVKRTNPTIKLYSYPQIQKSLRKILYFWSIRHPASGYVQGINDLVTPFFQIFLSNYIWQLQTLKRQKQNSKNDDDTCLFIPGLISEGNDDTQEQYLLNEDPNLLSYTLNNFDPGLISERVLSIIEADTYWCLSRLLDTITDNYIHEQPGIIKQVNDLKNLISKIDLELIRHFNEESIEFIQFSFRWMNCLLMRELSIDLIIRMWDTYLSESPIGFSNFHVYVCAAFLIKFSNELKLKDFQEILLFLQSPPTSSWTEKDIELMLSEAFIWQSLYKNASAHLR